ncbi:hypothetical protein BJF90_38705 [Pseudonocardia sp. CNS-004]|nr:hypothetical protein BJF90_38705 [Pseudonocardia sp. CNS-004]
MLTVHTRPPAEPSAAIEGFLASTREQAPYLVLDPGVVADRYAELGALLPAAAIHYAVKACPHPAVLHTLAALGSGFDVASPGEVRLALGAGADPDRICYGNPVRGPADVASAHAAGVRRFVTDSAEDVRLLAAHAPAPGCWCGCSCPTPGRPPRSPPSSGPPGTRRSRCSARSRPPG